ncbi:MAG: zinc ribbon domain-containing protein [Oscillospiraceae bacterium]|nr:zinc ribbon domain-containing protein [Oscillospiraceae bacterium]
MKYCSNCGSFIDETSKFCTNCGSPLNGNESLFASDRVQNNDPSYPTISFSEKARGSSVKKHSGLGITAFIFALTVFLSPVGLLLSIIDLVKNKKCKHGLSIAALCISSTILVIAVSGMFSNTSPSDSSTKAFDFSSFFSLEKSDDASRDSKIQDERQFKASCIKVVYRDVERSPNNYNGTKVKIEGRVVQVLESYGTTILRVATSDNGHDDIWYVEYKPASNEKRILSDDRIAAYGTCTGVEKYTGLLGNQVTIPSMQAKYVETSQLQKPNYSMNVLRFDVSKKSYGENYEYYAVVEIKNNGESNIYIKDVSFDIEDSSGKILKTDDYLIACCPNVLKPNEIGYLFTTYPITLDGLTKNDALNLVSSVTAEATHFSPSDYVVSDISVMNGNYGIKTTGRVTNNKTKDSSFFYIFAIYLGQDGSVLGIERESISGIAAGETTSFEISSFSMNSNYTSEDIAECIIIARDYYYGF